jgi:DNA mismatch repair ATPase MutS
MDRIFARINSSITTVGDSYLYAVLREPRVNKPKTCEREALMAFLADKPETRLELQVLLAKMGRADYSGLHQFNYEDAPELMRYPVLLNILTVLPVALMALFLVNPAVALLSVVASLVVNGVIHYRASRKQELYLSAVTYFNSMLWSVRRALVLLQDEEVPLAVRGSEIVGELHDACVAFEPIRSLLSGASRQTRMYTEAEYAIEFVRIVFLTQIKSYNRTVRFLAKHKSDFRALYRGLGELELALSVLSLRMSLPYHTCPEFTEVSTVRALGLYHPLLDEAVPNDAAITRNSLISGSNASGKSTFIKAVAINGILAQTINTCTATSFQLRPALVITSMAARDNILAGESYFIAEIRSLKRLIEQAQHRYCLCFVDEILKGTNTIERIAASAAILRGFNSLDSLCLVATHDIELTALLKDIFENYHFEEQVTDEGVSFDYLIRSGPSRTRNAIKLLATMGFDGEMVREAEALVEGYESSGRW